ncbi:hypothetical protein [Leucobacter sp. cx-169]|uniref:hypothetical protein n=1 Tax=Leucobacter sp. cx-169 TaxID=2770549 RepID=UPI00165D8D33|nr:hypothetical protein [Leucobacter sp. cx-169]MBC9927395.1 hypothetical protein [Leucobacter sp. cx-169]
MNTSRETITVEQQSELAKLPAGVTWYRAEDGGVTAVDFSAEGGVVMTFIAHDGITHTETYENGEWVLRGPDGAVIPDPELAAQFGE